MFAVINIYLLVYLLPFAFDWRYLMSHALHLCVVAEQHLGLGWFPYSLLAHAGQARSKNRHVIVKSLTHELIACDATLR